MARHSTWKRIGDDDSLRRSLLARANVLRRTRGWFQRRDFIEIDVPVLAPWVGMEPHLATLSTAVHDGAGDALRLHHQTSPEYALKKLLAAGIPDCFALGHVFRDGEVSEHHEPEFTLLEWYRRDADYTHLMRDTEQLVAALAEGVTGSPEVTRSDRLVDLAPPWDRITVAEAMARWANIDIETHADDAEGFRRHAVEQGYDWVRDESWDDLFYKLFLTHVEPNLGWSRPTILYEYPARFGALARRRPDKPAVVERFEAYVAGVELCNAFSELTDPDEQRERFRAEQEKRLKLGVAVPPIDEDLLDALAALPQCAGNALGIDRLIMLLTGEPEISRVVWFPWKTLRDWRDEHDSPT